MAFESSAALSHVAVEHLRHVYYSLFLLDDLELRSFTMIKKRKVFDSASQTRGCCPSRVSDLLFECAIAPE